MASIPGLTTKGLIQQMKSQANGYSLSLYKDWSQKTDYKNLDGAGNIKLTGSTYQKKDVINATIGDTTCIKTKHYDKCFDSK